MIPIACTVIHNFIRMDPASLARNHVTSDEDNDSTSSEDDVDALDGDGGESSS